MARLYKVVCFPFSRAGTLTTATGVSRIYIPQDMVFMDCRLGVNTAPTGASIIVDINKNGTTLFTTQGNRPTIAISGNSGAQGAAPDVTKYAAGDYATVDIDQIGSTVAGADLCVALYLRSL